MEEWDEKDKVDYERNKQFEKLTVETIAMKEKMEKMQLTFHKAQGWMIIFTTWRAWAPKMPLLYLGW